MHAAAGGLMIRPTKDNMPYLAISLRAINPHTIALRTQAAFACTRGPPDFSQITDGGLMEGESCWSSPVGPVARIEPLSTAMLPHSTFPEWLMSSECK